MTIDDPFVWLVCDVKGGVYVTDVYHATKECVSVRNGSTGSLVRVRRSKAVGVDRRYRKRPCRRCVAVEGGGQRKSSKPPQARGATMIERGQIYTLRGIESYKVIAPHKRPGYWIVAPKRYPWNLEERGRSFLELSCELVTLDYFGEHDPWESLDSKLDNMYEPGTAERLRNKTEAWQ